MSSDKETFRVGPDYACPLLVSRADCICEEQHLCIGHDNVSSVACPVWIAARRIEEGDSIGAGGLHRHRVKLCQMANDEKKKQEWHAVGLLDFTKI